MYTHTHTIMPLFFMAYFTSSIPVMPIPSSSSESRFSSCHPHDRESARTCQEMKVLVYRSSDIRVGVRETEGREGGREREREGETGSALDARKTPTHTHIGQDTLSHQHLGHFESGGSSEENDALPSVRCQQVVDATQGLR